MDVRIFENFNFCSIDEVHQIGLDEVKDLREKMLKAAKKLNYKDMELNQIFETVRNDKSQQFSSANETLKFFKDLVKKINPKLKKLFGPDITRPEVLDVSIEAAPNAGGTLAFFLDATFDGSRKGAFYLTLDNISIWSQHFNIFSF